MLHVSTILFASYNYLFLSVILTNSIVFMNAYTTIDKYCFGNTDTL